ncbi:hypothetical protein J3D43_001284 [Paenibacillus xylanexedens]|uniref:hypothetical protein n=1 Tax=Paenibacillus xylanexedens TaxID=528191 RepID=UPI00209DCA07|nr:hypothetical protein [Paenibacillus xylanexedens]MCP1422768.1 hypothetical protein [Paenibacillus xylanexedens]
MGRTKDGLRVVFFDLIYFFFLWFLFLFFFGSLVLWFFGSLVLWFFGEIVVFLMAAFYDGDDGGLLLSGLVFL